MEIYEIANQIKNILEDARKIPFSDKVIIDPAEILNLLVEFNNSMPDELKKARWIKEERERIIAEAQKDADDIIKEAENRIISMIDEHEITKKAYDKKTEIIAEANEKYREMSQMANTYVDEKLANVEDNMVELANTISKLELAIQSSLEKIQNDRKELK